MAGTEFFEEGPFQEERPESSRRQENARLRDRQAVYNMGLCLPDMIIGADQLPHNEYVTIEQQLRSGCRKSYFRYILRKNPEVKPFIYAGVKVGTHLVSPLVIAESSSSGKLKTFFSIDMDRGIGPEIIEMAKTKQYWQARRLYDATYPKPKRWTLQDDMRFGVQQAEPYPDLRKGRPPNLKGSSVGGSMTETIYIREPKKS